MTTLLQTLSPGQWNAPQADSLEVRERVARVLDAHCNIPVLD